MAYSAGVNWALAGRFEEGEGVLWTVVEMLACVTHIAATLGVQFGSLLDIARQVLRRTSGQPAEIAVQCSAVHEC